MGFEFLHTYATLDEIDIIDLSFCDEYIAEILNYINPNHFIVIEKYIRPVYQIYKI